MVAKVPRTVAALVALAFLASALAAPALAGATTAPKAREEKDKIVLENDQITVWFQGKKPMIKILPANKTEAAFDVKLGELVEFEDLDKNGAPSANEVRATLNLHQAKAWQITTTEEDGVVVLTMTLEAPLKYKGAVPETPLDDLVNKDRVGNVTLVFRLGSTTVTLPAGNTTLTLLPTETKFDLYVNKWTWADGAKNLLALTFDAGEKGNATLAETGPRAALGTANTTRGYFTWLETAEAVKDGANITVPVTGHALDEPGRYALVYGVGGFTSLLHDPTIGASPTGEPVTETTVPENLSTVPAAGTLLAVAAVGAAAVLVARRK
ncbi:MAG TPA: hypothetical protein VNZ52_02315 [Candidatus Thermoplasmatota archaeon]|nr:hypothetical protein [Candidatus Thermoplasmatota archaeon]